MRQNDKTVNEESHSEGMNFCESYSKIVILLN